MKKFILLAVPLLLSACMLSKTPTQDEDTSPIPTMSSEVAQPTPPEIPKEQTTKPTPTQTVKKTEVKNTKTDPKTDEMTEELDSIIDDMISGL